MAKYIDREAANKAVCELCFTSEGTCCVRCDRNPLRDIPAADVVEVRHGRWIWELADNGWANHICSECGYTKNTDIHVRLGYDYCPHCGAKMEDGNDNH